MAARKTDKPIGLDNISTLAAELDKDAAPYSFTFNGARFTTANPFDEDPEDENLPAQDDLVGNVKHMLGEEQYAKFREGKPKVRDYAMVLRRSQEYYEKLYGNPGESDGSQTS